MASFALDVIYWKKPVHTALFLAIGLAYFFAVGFLGWSSLGFISAAFAVTLLVRLVFFKLLQPALAAANVLQPPPPPVLPDQWLREEEVLPYLAWMTERLNALITSAVKLSYGEDVSLTGQWIASLLLVAYTCRLLGTTGFCFLLFASAFSLPRGYELKKPEVDAAYGVAKAHAERLRQSGEAKAQSAIVYVRQLSMKAMEAAPTNAKEAEEEKKKL